MPPSSTGSELERSPQTQTADAIAQSDISAALICLRESWMVLLCAIHHRATEMTESAVAAFFP